MGTSRSDIPIDTPLGKDTGAIRTRILCVDDDPISLETIQNRDSTILALCGALEEREDWIQQLQGRRFSDRNYHALRDRVALLGKELQTCQRALQARKQQHAEEHNQLRNLGQQLREAREENEKLRAQAHGEECSGLSDADVDELVATCKRLRALLRRWYDAARNVLFDSHGQQLRAETKDALGGGEVKSD